MSVLRYWCGTLILLGWVHVAVASHADIIVDQHGKGDYTTIAEAIEALPMFAYQRVVILIKNGVYEEKLRLDQSYVTLRGESRDSSIIRYSQLRSDWVADKDWIGPAVINIYGDDVVLDNLTIENTQPEIGPHAFAVYGTATRTIITNCNIISKGGDTVSLWNYKNGMYYHANCYFEGAVDFVCPRGWCFIRDSQFYEVKETAAIWHAGGFDPDQKLVIRNSEFDGVPGFQLGRHHYDAQFYLLDCKFSDNMADQPIYRKTYPDQPWRNNPAYYHDRNYFFNCLKSGEAFSWVANNLEKAAGSPAPDVLTPQWTFAGKWNPENTDPIQVIHFAISDRTLVLTFSEVVSVRGITAFVNGAGKEFSIVRQRYVDIDKLTFTAVSTILLEDLSGRMKMVEGDIIASRAYVRDRSVGASFRIR